MFFCLFALATWHSRPTEFWMVLFDQNQRVSLAARARSWSEPTKDKLLADDFL
jgi:hypothetical protein